MKEISTYEKGKKYTTNLRNRKMKEMGNGKWKLEIIKMFNEIIPLLSKKKDNLKPIATFGTLLGLIRDKDVICKDDDIDIMIDIKYFKKVLEIISNYQSDTYVFFKSKGYGIIFPTTITVINKKKLINIDIDFYSTIGKYVYRHVNEIFTRYTYGYSNIYLKSDIFPLKRKKILDSYLYVPNNANKILTHEYGENWKIPYFVCETNEKNPCLRCKKNPKYVPIRKGDKTKMTNKLKTNKKKTKKKK